MSQKYIKTQNKNNQSAAYGKYYAQAVYDSKFIETEELASFIQTQASVKKSDIIAVLQELGEAMKHFFELGQKIHLNGIGIFKVGFSAIGVLKKEDCSAATITTRRVLFQPETERVVVGQEKKPDGSIKQKYVIAKTLVKDVVFEETHDNSMNVEPEEDSSTGSETGGSGSQQGGGSSTSSETGGNGSSSSSESVMAPEISGTTPFTDTTQVTIQGPQGAEVRYTTDGSDPSAESTLYSEAITLNATTTI
ncbi:MAG: chitobiase/beta-hexosaminidase C-terminal domain-containing protein, partial [Prevotella sp.]|nr:chitobiase/beta-hexosaminidase C-terminal domain-containing protein [Prevotella sp.]